MLTLFVTYGILNIEVKQKGMILMMIIEGIQLMGGIFLTFATLPQITQVYITKNVSGLNLTTFIMILIGNLLQGAYGIYMAVNGYGFVLIISNSMAFCMILTLIVLIVKYRKEE